MKQRVILIFEDVDDGIVNASLNFDLSIAGDGVPSPAVQFALMALRKAAAGAEKDTDAQAG